MFSCPAAVACGLVQSGAVSCGFAAVSPSGHDHSVGARPTRQSRDTAAAAAARA